MKTYKDGVLEAAKLCRQIWKNASNERPDYWQNAISHGCLVCEKEIRALAAQEDQRSEAERIADARSKSSTQSSDHPTTADDLLRECLDWGLPEDLKDRIDAHLSRKEGK